MQLTPDKLREMGACEEGINNWVMLGGSPTHSNNPISPYANESRSYGIKVALKALRHALKEGYISKDDFDRDYYFLLKFKQERESVEKFFTVEAQPVYRVYSQGTLLGEYQSEQQAKKAYQDKVNVANNNKWLHYEFLHEDPNIGLSIVKSEEGLTHKDYSFWSKRDGMWLKGLSKEQVLDIVNNDLDERCKLLYKPVIMQQKYVEVDEQLVYWKVIYKDE